MRTTNRSRRFLHYRLEKLEKGHANEPAKLLMPDGRTEIIPSPGDFMREVLSRACRGERTPETELIARSISSTEPDGAHMIDLARAILNSP